MIREHLYLITNHMDKERVGQMKIMHKRLQRAKKNRDLPITKYNQNTNEFIDVGSMVYLGYHDFESEEQADDPDVLRNVMRKKVAEVDRKWAEKAGVEHILEDE